MGALLCATAGWMSAIMLIAAWENPTTPDVGDALGSTHGGFWGHLVLFGILGVLISSTVYYMKRWQHPLLGIIAAGMIGLVWGAVTEGYQLNVATRDSSLMDLLADLIGGIVGGVGLVVAYRILKSPALPRVVGKQLTQ